MRARRRSSASTSRRTQAAHRSLQLINNLGQAQEVALAVLDRDPELIHQLGRLLAGSKQREHHAAQRRAGHLALQAGVRHDLHRRNDFFKLQADLVRDRPDELHRIAQLIEIGVRRR